MSSDEGKQELRGGQEECGLEKAGEEEEGGESDEYRDDDEEEEEEEDQFEEEGTDDDGDYDEIGREEKDVIAAASKAIVGLFKEEKLVRRLDEVGVGEGFLQMQKLTSKFLQPMHSGSADKIQSKIHRARETVAAVAEVGKNLNVVVVVLLVLLVLVRFAFSLPHFSNSFFPMPGLVKRRGMDPWPIR